jgi:hypothetical protein
MRLLASSIVVLALVATLCSTMSVQAQRMSPEEAQAAWTLQASHVAGKLKLSKEQTTKLVDAYKRARESYPEALGKARKEARAKAAPEERRGMGRIMREVRQKVTKAETEKFAKDVGAFLGKKKTKQAVKQLRTFSGSLDKIVNIVAGLELDKEKQAKALDIVSAYDAESTAARQKAMAGGDRDAMRAVSEKQQAKLEEAMSKILSEAEFRVWGRATGSRSGGPGPRGRSRKGEGSPNR